MVCYSDSSIGKGSVGVRAVLSTLDGKEKCKTIPMEREVGVNDAKLEGMYQAAVIAVRYRLQNIRRFNYVHIFLHNQSAF